MAANPPPPLDVWAEHWSTVELFKRVRQRWVVGMGGPVCLDMPAVVVVAGIMGIRLTRRRLDEIILLEHETLRRLREK